MQDPSSAYVAMTGVLQDLEGDIFARMIASNKGRGGEEKGGEERGGRGGRGEEKEEGDGFPFTPPFEMGGAGPSVVETVLDVILCARMTQTSGRLRLFAAPRAEYAQLSTWLRDAPPGGPFMLCSDAQRALVREHDRSVCLQSIAEAAAVVEIAPFVAIVRCTCRGDVSWLEARLSDVPYYAYVAYYHRCQSPRQQQLLMKLVAEYTTGTPGARLLLAKYRYFFQRDNDEEYFRQNIYTKQFALTSTSSTTNRVVLKHADNVLFVFTFPPAYY